MLHVSAQAKSCDLLNGGTPDNATEQETKNRNQTAQTPQSQTISPDQAAGMTASTLAAKILQMSTATGKQPNPSLRKPKILWQDDNTPLDIPAVYQSMPGSVWQSDQTDRIAGRRRPNSVRNGPSFKTLLVSTILIAVAGGGALALGLNDLLETQQQDVTRQVQTETITPKLTIEGVIAANSDVHVGNDVGVKPAQITKAKDRIRQAFATGTEDRSSVIYTPGVQTTYSSRAQSQTIQLANAQSVNMQRNAFAIAPPSESSTAKSIHPPAPGQALSKTTSIAPAAIRKEASPAVASTHPPENPSSALNNASQENAGIITASVNMRQSDDKAGKVIGVIPEGTEVRFGDCGKWWCQVEFDGRTGYVGQKFVNR